MRKVYFLFFTFLVYLTGYGQKVQTVYLNPTDSVSNLYLAVYPPKLPWTGYMFLIPGMFQKPQDVLVQTGLPKIAAQKGILTIIPTFKSGISSMGVDTATQASFLAMVSNVRSKYKLTDQPFYAGGFSIGGTCALKYAELALSHDYAVKPAAVFAIDSPLDFERMYQTSVKELRIAGTNEEVAAENQYMLKRFDKEFGGSPDRFQSSYHNSSPYSFSDTNRHAILPLVNLPIRLYTEPDIHWALTQGTDYYGMNAFDFAAMTNDLRRMGSKNITLITTTNKGYRRPGNVRHPHSWSIAEPYDLVRWLLRQR
jgi:hypothetical protein